MTAMLEPCPRSRKFEEAKKEPTNLNRRKWHIKTQRRPNKRMVRFITCASS